MKLDNKKVILVGFAFLLIQAFWIAYDAIVPLMLVNKFGMNQTWSGLIMALDNILAVVLLPIFGSVSDKCTSKMGKRKPFILIGTLCAVVAFFALSGVDYVQYKNLGAQADMPYAAELIEATEEQQASAARAKQAQSVFWEKNYSLPNNENTNLNKNHYRELGSEVLLRDYVSQMLYVKNYADLTEPQQLACRDFYENVLLNTSYVFNRSDDGVKQYNIYEYAETQKCDSCCGYSSHEEFHTTCPDCGGKLKTETLAYKLTYTNDGARILTAVDQNEAKDVRAQNVYSTLVTTARSDYAAELTYKNPVTLVVFIAILLIVLISMATFRSPAVALMPDVVVKPLRSKANAIINLMGVVGGVAVYALGFVMGVDKISNQLMPDMGYIGGICIIMLVALIVFMLTVKEPEWNRAMLEAQARLDEREEAKAKACTVTEDKETEYAEREALVSCDTFTEALVAEEDVIKNVKTSSKNSSSSGKVASTKTKSENSGKKAESVHKLDRSQFISLLLILASVAFWYMGYNAVSSKYSLYAINVLNKPYTLILIVAQVAALIAFIPLGILSGVIGRKKTILIGVGVLTAAFACAYFVRRNTPDIVMYILFSVAGIAWAAINVNSFPMVVELAKGSDIGKYTGYYYTASMAAQIVTPLLSGVLMDLAGNMTPLFIYSTFFVGLSFVTMLFVRHGDSVPEKKKDKLEYLDVSDD